ncbi:hypothetical protein J437_LFUL019358 [Ladona fulva]|uniref:Mutator-like transposase domain-containing protein n=1 Tax=Ladona fulva TaxID=123851 RepID=A0A8K0KLH5_LADFU|nr:hypothetical protein J437_LFUL019358 [Ladona fulva]
MCKRKGKDVTEHQYYKKWKESSTAMKSDTIVEGFKLSVEMHNMKCWRQQHNPKIVEGNATWARVPLQKIEFINHLLRSYSSNLRDLARKQKNGNGRVPILLRKKIGENLLRLRVAVCTAISYRARMTCGNKVKLLEDDTRQGPDHVFGDHRGCSSYFFQGPKEVVKSIVPDLISSGLWEDILYATSFLYRHSPSLILNVTNNLAETYNSYVAKYVGGVLTGHKLHNVIHKGLTNSSPGDFTKKFSMSSEKRSETKRMRQSFSLFEEETRASRGAGPALWAE